MPGSCISLQKMTVGKLERSFPAGLITHITIRCAILRRRIVVQQLVL
jgi:hypothetical protein